MITGDHLLTAHAVAEEVGLLHDDKYLFSGDHLSSLGFEERKAAYIKGNIFARVRPEQKYELVEVLKSTGQLAATDWLVDLEVNASIVLGANDLEERADGAGSLALATNDISHVGWINIKRDEHAAFVDRAHCFHSVRIVDDSFDDHLHKHLISFHNISVYMTL
jgi:hypothetical protein